jgi:saccharopine dehydrogenase (NAD+, L-lysine forming)
MNYEFREDPRNRECPGLSLIKKQTLFPGEPGRKRAFPFNFLERHTLPHTLGIGTVDTWIAFDSAATTWGFMLGKKMGLSRFADSPKGRRFMLSLMKKAHIGSERYAVKIEMQGRIAGQPCGHEAGISGMGEARATGIVTAEAADRLMTGACTPGVYYMEQLFELHDFMETLHQRGLVFEFSDSVPVRF